MIHDQTVANAMCNGILIKSRTALSWHISWRASALLVERRITNTPGAIGTPLASFLGSRIHNPQFIDVVKIYLQDCDIGDFCLCYVGSVQRSLAISQPPTHTLHEH